MKRFTGRQSQREGLVSGKREDVHSNPSKQHWCSRVHNGEQVAREESTLDKSERKGDAVSGAGADCAAKEARGRTTPAGSGVQKSRCGAALAAYLGRRRGSAGQRPAGWPRRLRAVRRRR